MKKRIKKIFASICICAAAMTTYGYSISLAVVGFKPQNLAALAVFYVFCAMGAVAYSVFADGVIGGDTV